ncbi:MAG: hypothetical protein NZ740_10730 [Kiritimatiellae bacterium]|nr:hypothetical protein [Kiritimatiellia bacterium]MDW8459558.1 hypothetical protein [Verrucomicrobiota bacterium]
MAQDDEHLKKGYKRGKWAGKMVTLKKNRILTPFKRGQKIGHEYSYRAALMPGALDIAKGMGFAETFPDAQDETIQPPNGRVQPRCGATSAATQC